MEQFELFRESYSVLLPIEFIKNKYIGEVKGIKNSNTGIFNIFGKFGNFYDPRIELLGEIINEEDEEIVIKKQKNDLLGIWEKNELSFYYKQRKIEYKTYSIESDIVSRNKGIVDNLHLKESYAVIVGCGSVGSLIALELARGGVGKFILVDNDIFSYHNISRHQCGIFDVGKRKVDALEERIFQINPNAQIKSYFNIIQDVSFSELKESLDNENGIIINCGDNRLSSYYSNSLAMDLNLYFISASASFKATYGELFWYIPQKGLPCYGCVYGDNYNVNNNNETIRHWYADEEELSKENFIPALSVDIDYISIIATKLALDLLMLTSQNYKPRYIQYSTQLMFISNYLPDKEEQKYGITEPLQIVKTKTEVRKDCLLCKNKQ